MQTSNFVYETPKQIVEDKIIEYIEFYLDDVEAICRQIQKNGSIAGYKN